MHISKLFAKRTTQVYIQQSKIGDQLIIETPKRKMTLTEWLDTLEPIDEPFPEIEDPPPEPVDL